MIRSSLLLLATGVLLAAPPAASPQSKTEAAPVAVKVNIADPQVVEGRFVWFSLDATPDAIARRLGPPARTNGNQHYLTWEYFVSASGHEDPSHTFLFRRSDQKLVSVTRAYEEPQNVDALFPEASTKRVHWPADKPTLSARVRLLPGGGVLIAVGSSKPGEPTNQLVLVRREAIPIFFNWLEPLLGK